MPEAQTIYTQTRAAEWPAPEGSHVTVTARRAEDEDAVAITWQRDDLAAKGAQASIVILTVDELRGIVAALDERRGPFHGREVDPARPIYYDPKTHTTSASPSDD
ncbi:hypothetical protein V5D56_00075 (plasmid) [Cellulosimicrobium sp. PMB13]|uniref:hypothetical protein n=1 Tax=Cellulosimicrobium sp. PMB13 TaxID=3120158 RepID=UPI003F4B36A7